ncbi:hypothetical protein CRE_18495 [Caenorhabditis remanei]|uniref:Serpentine receptor class r-10 n=1 Tax=Caenorhabditis remanei TaxID=31234 RepID=E3LKV5_CAERE|nr:hypothetical protein CRE_18495 [Caenorhabditis remanei]
MSDAIWLIITQKSAAVGTALSFVINFILLVFLSTLPLQALGPYKYLMTAFSVFSVFYTLVEWFLKPLIHIYDDTCFVLQRKAYDYSHTVARAISATYCGCLAASFTLFAVHFIYRYLAVCFPMKLKFFKGSSLLYWALGVFLTAASWANFAFFCFPGNERTLESFQEVAQRSYNLDIRKVDYVAYTFWKYENGIRRIDILSIVGVIQHLIVMFISFCIVFYCGIHTVIEMRKHRSVSKTTKRIQKQLFKALVFQTAFPMIFIYIPTLMVFFTPILNLDIGAYGNIAIVTIHLYPGVDPLILLILISDFRSALGEAPKKIMSVTSSVLQRSSVIM